ncbi:DUF6966 domain-containing protein [Paucibacter sp. M5-1]|uniref:DUF6966 domain-containing protein n=1 Tax=Paucibacter sp. M5-1 TaxID=3015998 RepID=UPI0022B90DC9|nr:hypothetical protein [Paucibacter sp. M5-1]MCZ7883206.1 hypothetical protein [Paucibacter sp. M5-1]
MHPEIVKLVDMLDEAAALLRKHRDDHRASWMERDAQLIRSLDFYGVQHLLQAFGGMGSLNDVTFTQPNIDGRVVGLVDDDRISALRQKIYELAHKLAQEESAASPGNA